MNSKTIISPGRYVQGPGALEKLADYCETFGSKVLVVADDFVMNLSLIHI